MKKKLLLFMLIIVTITFFVLFQKESEIEKDNNDTRETISVSIDNHQFQMTLSDIQGKRTAGLSGTEKLEEDEGMLFVFDRSDYHGIWMKDMNYALDILWLDCDKNIITIRENISPATYPEVFLPTSRACYVVEIPQGSIERLWITYFSKVIF
ncbi:MAG: uncharacterized membrane protein (UPF0127 family) [Flavobacteriaceae bacterium]|jgi:uncharacterized membrane protein (UPF0127 family)